MPEEPAAPAAPDKPDEEIDKLFNETEAPAPEMPADEPKSPGDEADDLFKDPDDKKAAAEPAPADPMNPMDKASEKELEEVFAEPADKMAATAPEQVVPASATPEAMRLWVDNTGKFRVRAVLVSVSDTHVRLLKDTGKYTTVPIGRLSQGDLAFVRQHATNSLAGKF